MLLRPLFFAFLLATSAAGAGNVHIVASGGDLQAAIDAAADGDLIRVQPGPTHGNVLVLGKALSIVGDGGAFTAQSISILNTQPTQEVTVRGAITEGALIGSFPIYSQPPLRIVGCGGGVVVEDLTVTPGQPFGSITVEGCFIENSPRVTLARCEIIGEIGATYAPVGLKLVESKAALYDCLVVGGEGKPAFSLGPFSTPSTAGGLGAELLGNSELLCSGTVIRGGNGGDGAAPALSSCDLPPANGGSGLKAGAPFGSKPKLRLVDSMIQPGLPGNPFPGCPGAQSGQMFYPNTIISIDTFAEPKRSLVAAAIMKESSNGSVTLNGLPGEAAFLLISPGLDVTYVPGLVGTLVPAFPLILAPVGSLDASGQRTLTVPVPPNVIPPACGFVPVRLQMLVPGATGNGALGSPSIVALLHAGA